MRSSSGPGNEEQTRLPYSGHSNHFSSKLRDDFQSAVLTRSHFAGLADSTADLLVLIIAC